MLCIDLLNMNFYEVPAFGHFSFLLFKNWGVVTGNSHSTEVFITNRLRPFCGCFCREDPFLGQLWEEVGKETRERAGEANAVLMPGAVLAEVDMQNQGATASGSGSYPEPRFLV